MKKTFALLAGSAVLLAACAGGEEEVAGPPMISEITVSTDLQSIGNAEAVSYWQGLSSDLETALAAEFVNNISPTGAIMTVDVDEISLANSYTATTGDNARLTGTVVLTEPGAREEVISTYNVSATSNEAAALIVPAEGTTVTTISPTSTEFYASVVAAFAQGVYRTVQQGGVAPAS